MEALAQQLGYRADWVLTVLIDWREVHVQHLAQGKDRTTTHHPIR